MATGRIERTLPFRMAVDEILDCGEDTGTPVTEDHHMTFKVTIGLTPVILAAADAQKVKEAHAAIAVAQ